MNAESSFILWPAWENTEWICEIERKYKNWRNVSVLAVLDLVLVVINIKEDRMYKKDVGRCE